MTKETFSIASIGFDERDQNVLLTVVTLAKTRKPGFILFEPTPANKQADILLVDADKPEAEPAALKEGAGRSADAGPADELDAESMGKEIEKELNACQTVVQAEKEKMRDMLKASLDALHAEMDELKGKLGSVEEVQGA